MKKILPIFLILILFFTACNNDTPIVENTSSPTGTVTATATTTATATSALKPTLIPQLSTVPTLYIDELSNCEQYIPSSVETNLTDAEEI